MGVDQGHALVDLPQRLALGGETLALKSFAAPRSSPRAKPVTSGLIVLRGMEGLGRILARPRAQQERRSEQGRYR